MQPPRLLHRRPREIRGRALRALSNGLAGAVAMVWRVGDSGDASRTALAMPARASSRNRERRAGSLSIGQGWPRDVERISGLPTPAPPLWLSAPHPAPADQPGSAVAAIASLLPLDLRFGQTSSIRAGRSRHSPGRDLGTTPPNGRCAASCPASRWAKTRRSEVTSAAAVSSQLDSMPRIRLIAASLPLRRRLAQARYGPPLAHRHPRLAARARAGAHGGRHAEGSGRRHRDRPDHDFGRHDPGSPARGLAARRSGPRSWTVRSPRAAPTFRSIR